MNKIQEKRSEEYQTLSLLSGTPLLTEPIAIDNNLAQLCIRSTTLECIEPYDNNVHILWLTNEDKLEAESLNGMNVRIYHSNNDLIDSISELQTSYVFLIIDYELVTNILSFLDDFTQIEFIYVLTKQRSTNTALITDSKRSIRKISNNKSKLFRLITEDIDICTKDLIFSTVFDLTTAEESTMQTQNASFIWHYLLIESLFDSTVYNDTAKKDLIEYCRQQISLENIQEQESINKFEQNYVSEDAIKWYTDSKFIFRELNKALRLRDIDAIFKFRFFMIDFQKQLEQHYDEEIMQSVQTVYRGQEISPLELTKLKNSIHKYISFNTYVSTTIDEKVASIYAGGPSSVLLEIEMGSPIYLKNKRIRPVYVQDKSKFQDELEVIFPIGSTFLLDSIEMKNNQWNIRLKLTNEADYDHMIDLIQRVYMKNMPPKLKFAELILSLGDIQKGERYIKMLIEDLELSADKVNIGYAYNIMGQVCLETGDNQCALSYFEKALKNQPENRYPVNIYCNLGNLYREKNEYTIALEYLNEALKHKQEIDLLELAHLYDMFANIYREMGNFDEALYYVNQSLDIRQPNRTAHHGDWITYCSIALIHAAKSDYTESLQYLRRALNIASEILPKTHPSFIYLYAFTGFMCFECQDSSLAMKYLRKAVNLIQTTQPGQNFNRFIYIFVWNLCAQLYNTSMNTTNAFYYAQEALQVYNQLQNLIPKSSVVGRSIQINLGLAYLRRCDYEYALESFKKALDLSKSINDQMSTLFLIGKVYFDQGYLENALHCFEESVQLNPKTSQSIVDDDTAYWIYIYMSDVYKYKNDLDKSIFYVKEAQRLQMDKTNTDFRYIAQCYTRLMDLCPKQKKTYIEEILNIVQTHDLPISARFYCYSIIGSYYYTENDFANALHYYKSSLKYQLMSFPPCYQELIYTYAHIGHIYKERHGEDSAIALFYFKKSRDTYLELSKMEEIPTNDKHRMIVGEGYFVENINQCSEMTSAIWLVYYSIATYYAKKRDREQAFNHLQKAEEILNQYQGKKQPIIQKDVYFLIASTYQLIQYYDRAIFYYEKRLPYMLDDYNEYAHTCWLIAINYYRKKEYSMAISKCKIALTLLHNSTTIDNEKIAGCYRYAAMSYERLKNYEYCFIYSKQAIEHFLLCDSVDYNSVISLCVTGVNALYFARPWNCDEPLKYILTAMNFSRYPLTHSSLRALHSSVGFFYYLNANYCNAIFHYNQALEYSTESYDIIDIHYKQTLCFAVSGQIDKAYDIVKKRIDYLFNLENLNFIDMSDSYIDMGLVYNQLGNYKLALICYQSAFYILEKHQDDRAHDNYRCIYNSIANIYLEYGQIIDAFLFCLKARNIRVSNTKKQSSLTSIYITMGLIECKLKNYYKALDYFGQAWECLFNDNIHSLCLHRILYNHIGYVYFKLGQTEIAMKNYLKSLSLYSDCRMHPELAQVYKNVGLIYEHDEKMYSIALAYYRRALAVLPNKEHPHYILYKSMVNTLQKKMSLWEKLKSFIFS
ncbi:unnamed protein product [Rotaria sp. Silwood2]|nr:unnamed protein product [Rotaria sp. Silwood2]